VPTVWLDYASHCLFANIVVLTKIYNRFTRQTVVYG
jgi:hypothetical protein